MSRTCRRQVQAQYGPGIQEMGGFWPSAASALAKGAVGEDDTLTALDAGEDVSKLPGNASVWQAPHDRQDTPWASPLVAPSPPPEASTRAESPQSWPAWTAGIAW